RPRSERKSAGIERLIAPEHESASVKLVGSRLRDEVDDAVRRPAKFRGVAATLHLELLETLDADSDKSGIVPALAVGFGAVQAFALTIEQSAADARVALITDDAWSKNDEGHRAPQSVAQEQRQILNRLGRHDLAEIGSFCCQQRHASGDLHR